MRPIELKGKSHNLYVGDSFPILVNCNVGGNNLSAIDSEKEKIEVIDALIRVYNSFLSEKIDDYNSSVYYENPSYLLECYLEKKVI